MTLLSRYGTLDTRTERRLTNGHDKARGCTKIVSKTTYKLKKFNGATSELDSAGEENYEENYDANYYDDPSMMEYDSSQNIINSKGESRTKYTGTET